MVLDSCDPLFTFDLPSDAISDHYNASEEEEELEASPYSSTIREVVEGLPHPQEPVNGVKTSSLAASFLQPQGELENSEAGLTVDEQETDSPQSESRPQGAVARIPTTPSSPGEGHQEEGRSDPPLSLILAYF